MRIGEKRLRALKISTFAITSVVIVEVALGFAAGSLAILSDGAHALLDAISTFILLIATKASLKPADEEHMYGHEKIEPLGGLIGGVILFGTAIFLIIRALQKILQGEITIVQEWESAGFAAIAYTLCVDILRVGVLHKTQWESVTVKAGFYHALADLGSTLIALFGFGMAASGFPIFDVLTSLVLSTAIGYLSVKLVRASGMELSDAVTKEFAEKVRKEILSTEGVSKVGNLRVRRAGAKTFVEATIQVPDYISLEESHTFASKVEDNLKRFLGDAEVIVHIEPQEEMLTKKLVEKLAADVEGVKEVHEINVVYTHNKLYITLHAYVDPKLSVRKAHELAEKIEDKLNEKIENIGNITVHIEPFDSKQQRGPTVDDEEIRQVIYRTAKSYHKGLTIKRIITYVVSGKRYINIECCFTSQISIEEAHRVASTIENDVKRKFTETMVTVHVEPKKEEAAA